MHFKNAKQRVTLYEQATPMMHSSGRSRGRHKCPFPSTLTIDRAVNIKDSQYSVAVETTK